MLPMPVQIALDYWKSGERTAARMQGLITHVCDTYCVQGDEKERYIELALNAIKGLLKRGQNGR